MQYVFCDPRLPLADTPWPGGGMSQKYIPHIFFMLIMQEDDFLRLLFCKIKGYDKDGILSGSDQDEHLRNEGEGKVLHGV